MVKQADKYSYMYIINIIFSSLEPPKVKKCNYCLPIKTIIIVVHILYFTIFNNQMRTNQIIRLESNGNGILSDFKVLFSKLKSETSIWETQMGRFIIS